MRHIPFHVTRFLKIRWNLAGVALGNKFCHETCVVLVKALVTLKLPFQPENALFCSRPVVLQECILMF